MSCVEAADVEIAQLFRHFVSCAVRVRVEKGFALLLNLQWPRSDLVGFFLSRLVVIVYSAGERDPAKSMIITKSGSAHERGLSLNFDEEVGELARKKAALRSDAAYIGA